MTTTSTALVLQPVLAVSDFLRHSLLSPSLVFPRLKKVELTSVSAREDTKDTPGWHLRLQSNTCSCPLPALGLQLCDLPKPAVRRTGQS
ncbi:uncharacterized protein B0T15DRAFT_6516 [Chaetomium strumarium]|uniref:Uncharacterized protein n=1 Tax=Chaetomium strumarium TaxID=1170767 RepID=A0AAJ0M582_9PEZI|nr:hypothetical protein B0T15DRAFT_6516 [Chaetomium strumarium]